MAIYKGLKELIGIEGMGCGMIKSILMGTICTFFNA